MSDELITISKKEYDHLISENEKLKEKLKKYELSYKRLESQYFKIKEQQEKWYRSVR